MSGWRIKAAVQTWTKSTSKYTHRNRQTDRQTGKQTNQSIDEEWMAGAKCDRQGRPIRQPATCWRPYSRNMSGPVWTGPDRNDTGPDRTNFRSQALATGYRHVKADSAQLPFVSAFHLHLHVSRLLCCVRRVMWRTDKLTADCNWPAAVKPTYR